MQCSYWCQLDGYERGCRPDRSQQQDRECGENLAVYTHSGNN